MKKNILIINTGGTISSVETSEGVQPKEGLVKEMMQQQSLFFHPEMPNFQLIELEPLIDSSNIGLKDWNHLAGLIENNADKYDGFVILHGTDTMAYTASSLSFLLMNLDKPVILTGSQIPFSALRTDATSNLINALQLSANSELNEVCVYFNHKLFRGNRSTKKSSTQFLAFDSPNFPSLATIGTDIRWQTHLLKESSTKPLTRTELKPSMIANVRLVPGMSNTLIQQLLALKLDGLIIETYGSGNAPTSDEAFLALLKSARNTETIIVNVSQCYQSSAARTTYQAGKKLEEAGVLAGHDLTIEAAYTKLQYLLSLNLSKEQLESQMTKSICGEMSMA
jgi:L-asparaginase